ncbi:MAG: VWA domain-containing protein [Sedimentisphaerales bacterium]|nr:VWA domain-containing protein [Sedimentisphaerales bacterium]
MKRFLVSMLMVIVVLTSVVGATEAEKAVKTTTQPKIEVVFVLDTTGSMSGLIAAAKEKIWSIANTLAMTQPAPEIKMGLVGYRDRGDDYVTKCFELTNDLDAVYAFLMGFSANGGGDGPESVNQALHEAVTKMKWSSDTKTYKVIFLVGDYPPHMDYNDDIKHAESCRLACKNGIVINTVQCGKCPDTEPFWRQIAKNAEGEFFRVEQSGSAIAASTPFDGEIAALSKEMDGTRLYYGTERERSVQTDRVQKSEEFYEMAPASAVASRASFNAKEAGTDNFTGGQELVSDIAKGKVALSELKAEQMDEKLRAMSEKDRETYVADMAKKRDDLQQKIQKLSAQRQEYIQKEINQKNLKEKDSLDRQVYECIKTQAGKRDIKYVEGPVY